MKATITPETQWKGISRSKHAIITKRYIYPIYRNQQEESRLCKLACSTYEKI